MRNCLSRLRRDGKASWAGYGNWRSPKYLVREEPAFYDLKFHGLKAEAGYGVKGGHFLDMWQRVTTFWPEIGEHKHPRNWSMHTKGEWDGRTITCTVHSEKTAKIEVFMEASMKPLGLLDAYLFLKSVLVTVTGIPPELWEISLLGINDDFDGDIKTKLGVTHLSIAGLGNLLAQLYEKTAIGKTRAEAHIFDRTPMAAILDRMKHVLEAVEYYRKGESA